MNSPATSVALDRSGSVDQADQRCRVADELRGCAPGSTQVSDRGVVVGLGQLPSIRAANEWMMGEGRWGLAAEEARQSDLGRCRLKEVAAPDHQVDPLAQVIDDDREPVGPVPVAIADRQVAAPRGDLIGARPDERVHPALGATAKGHPEDRPGQPAIPAAAGAAESVPAASVIVRPRLEGRPRAVAPVHQRLVPQPLEGGLIRGLVLALSQRTVVRHEPEPGEVLEKGRIVFGTAARPVVVLDPQEDRRIGSRCHPPDIDGIRDVTEMEIAGRGGREPGPRHGASEGLARTRAGAVTAWVTTTSRSTGPPRAASSMDWRIAVSGGAPGPVTATLT